jgi:hypothetical protein
LREGQAEIEARRRQRAEALARQADALAKDYAAACAVLRAVRGSCLAVNRVRKDGLVRAIGLEVAGMGCVTVPSRDWQAPVLADAVDVAVAGSRPTISVKGAMRKIRERGWIHRRFSRITDAEAAVISGRGTAFEPPEDAVMAWIVALSRGGILMPSSGAERWLLHRIVVDEVRDLRRRRTLPGMRQTELRKAVAGILKDIPEDEVAGFSFEGWFGKPLPGREYSPASAMHFDDAEFGRLMTELANIGGAIRFSPRTDTDLMGLPLAGTLARRLEDRRREADARAARVLDYAKAAFGTNGSAWSEAPADGLGGRSPADAARESATGLAESTRLLDALVRQRECEARRARAAASAREELRREAAKLLRGEHLDLYMRAGHTALGGQSPLAYCVDETTLRRCVALTLTPGRQRR